MLSEAEQIKTVINTSDFHNYLAIFGSYFVFKVGTYLNNVMFIDMNFIYLFDTYRLIHK